MDQAGEKGRNAAREQRHQLAKDYDPDRDLSEVNRATTMQDARRFQSNQWNLIRDIIGSYAPNLLKFGRFGLNAFTADMWSGIIDDLIDPTIVRYAKKRQGYKDGEERIHLTEEFFMSFILMGLQSKSLQDVLRSVNIKHMRAGLVEPVDQEQGNGKPGPQFLHMQIRSDLPPEEYSKIENSFLYVIGSMVERMRDALERQGIERESPKGRQLAERLREFWYQIGGCVGLVRVPKDVAAHERFIAAHEKNIFEHDEGTRVKAREMAQKFIPTIAEICGMSPKEFIDHHIRPEVRKTLGGFGDLETIEKKKTSLIGFVTKTISNMVRRALSPPPLWMQQLEKAVLERGGDLMVNAVLDYCRAHPAVNLRAFKTTPGTTLIQQGAQRSTVLLPILFDQPLSVLVKSNGNGSVEVAQITRPTLLGEIGVHTRTPAGATVESVGAVSGLVIPAKEFDSMMKDKNFRSAVLLTIRERMKHNEDLLREQVQKEGLPENDTSNPIEEVLLKLGATRSGGPTVGRETLQVARTAIINAIKPGITPETRTILKELLSNIDREMEMRPPDPL